MDQIEILAQIRSLVREKLNQFGDVADAVPTESVLIRDGYFCGRRFECHGLQAVWFVEELQIKFYDRTGAIIEVLGITSDLLNVDSPQKKAA